MTFIAVDLPAASDLTVEIMALVAQAGRKAILQLTKETLAVATARGEAGQPEQLSAGMHLWLS